MGVEMHDETFLDRFWAFSNGAGMIPPSRILHSVEQASIFARAMGFDGNIMYTHDRFTEFADRTAFTWLFLMPIELCPKFL